MKTVKQIKFYDIFCFAKKVYGLEWNPCNKIFFGNAFNYGNVTDFDGWTEYVEEELIDGDEFKKALSFTKEEVLAMSDNDKSYVITAAYLESIGLDNEEMVQIDSR